MAEALGIGESVSVTVTRANPLAGSTGSFPAETIAVVIGVIIAIAIIVLAVKKYRGAGYRPVSRRGIFWKSFAVAAILGFAAFLLSGNTLSWVMAAGLFYYEFRIRRAAEGQ